MANNTLEFRAEALKIAETLSNMGWMIPDFGGNGMVYLAKSIEVIYHAGRVDGLSEAITKIEESSQNGK